MKKNFIKITTLVISCLLLIGMAIGISVSATDDPTVEIYKKKLSYGDSTQILYSIDATDGYTVKLLVSDEAEFSAPEKGEFLSEENGYKVKNSTGKITISGKEYETAFSDGIAPKDMTKTVYALPVLLDTDGKVAASGALTEYTVYDYVMERFTASPTRDQTALYSALLNFGASVQAIISTEDEIAKNGWADAYYILDTNYVVNGNSFDIDYKLLRAKDVANTTCKYEAPISYEGKLFAGFAEKADLDPNYRHIEFAFKPGMNTVNAIYSSTAYDYIPASVISTTTAGVTVENTANVTMVDSANGITITKSGTNAGSMFKKASDKTSVKLPGNIQVLDFDIDILEAEVLTAGNPIQIRLPMSEYKIGIDFSINEKGEGVFKTTDGYAKTLTKYVCNYYKGDTTKFAMSSSFKHDSDYTSYSYPDGYGIKNIRIEVHHEGVKKTHNYTYVDQTINLGTEESPSYYTAEMTAETYVPTTYVYVNGELLYKTNDVNSGWQSGNTAASRVVTATDENGNPIASTHSTTAYYNNKYVNVGNNTVKDAEIYLCKGTKVSINLSDMVYTTLPEKNYAYETVYREYIFDDTSVLKGYNGLSDTNTTLLDADFETASATLTDKGKSYGFACLATDANGNKYVELGRGASDHGGLKFNTVSEDTESEDIAYYVMQADLKLIALNPVPTKADNWPIRMRMYSGANYFCEIELYPVFDAEGKVTHVQLSKQPAIAVSSTADFITLTLKYDVVNNSGKLYINGVEAGPLDISSNPDNVFSYGYISLRGATYCYGEKLVIGIDNVKLYGIEYK